MKNKKEGSRRMNAKLIYEQWLNSPVYDDEIKKELIQLKGDDKEIEERFYKELEFGTAGLRGIIGAGTNRMNKYTVRKATQGLSNYILSQHLEGKGVAIAYDSRNMSPEFAMETACCFAANGIKAYLFESLRPTPELSFAVRFYECVAGVNVTASHNPPEYNGYKVYWSDGAQITPPHDLGIMDEVRGVKAEEMKTISKEEALESNLLNFIGEEVDEAYLRELEQLVFQKDVIREFQDQIKIVYTPLHGTGNIPVREILKRVGFSNVFVVKEQELPDGNFPTVSYPNPETQEAFMLGLQLAKKIGADLILATDPDADRLGVYVLDKNGEYHSLTGNMSGCLLGEYVLSQYQEKNLVPDDGFVVRSIVTTRMLDAIAKGYHVDLVEVLTGFKFIGQKILESETSGKGKYLFGMEESYGCLPGTYARDKDAVVASMILCEMAAFYKSKNQTLWDGMLSLYERFGYYEDQILSATMEGKDGLTKIQQIMEQLEREERSEIGGFKVLRKRNYQTGIIDNYEFGIQEKTNLPQTNALYFDLEGDGFACVRPSGTEPKIKVYYGVKGVSLTDAKDKSEQLKQGVSTLVR
jgi:phosphoglucomutase